LDVFPENVWPHSTKASPNGMPLERTGRHFFRSSFAAAKELKRMALRIRDKFSLRELK
jgi:hypothetical protein